MKKRNVVILLSALLAILIAAAILIGINMKNNPNPDNTDPVVPQNTVETTVETEPELTIGVDATEPSIDADMQIDFDDLIAAGN